MRAISRYFNKVANWVSEPDSLAVGMLRLYAISFILLIQKPLRVGTAQCSAYPVGASFLINHSLV